MADGSKLIDSQASPAAAIDFRSMTAEHVPDPASRFQPEDVHGPSQVIDPDSFRMADEDWRGRPWEEAVIYELHVGAFTPEGTFRAAEEKLDYLADSASPQSN